MTTVPQQPDHSRADDFVSNDELIRRHGARPITSLHDLTPDVDLFESDEEYEAFLADLYASRRADIA